MNVSFSMRHLRWMRAGSACSVPACPLLAVACAKLSGHSVSWAVGCSEDPGAVCAMGVSLSRNKGVCQEVTALLQSRRNLPMGSALPWPSLNLCPCPLIPVLIQSVPEAGHEPLHCCVPVLLGQPSGWICAVPLAQP